ncbi:hypothetical protein FH972_024248 [Carpinus fangiana]|uniref:Uncharacterized protein n=1 Tax=Carpinus fangiana TaxID=176857 RepID=A0A5N6KXX9_9ROSI|nr:hypothetical protein FH972_024248 [Carpinus fangiana]
MADKFMMPDLKNLATGNFSKMVWLMHDDDMGAIEKVSQAVYAISQDFADDLRLELLDILKKWACKWRTREDFWQFMTSNPEICIDTFKAVIEASTEAVSASPRQCCKTNYCRCEDEDTLVVT